jgi:hypothetical protein
MTLTDYSQVTKALAEGVQPAMICATCPWDRNCVNPPSMTAGEVDRLVSEASEKDQAQILAAQAAGRKSPMPTATLLVAAVYAGRDTALQACPVLGVRLRSADGRRVAETVRSAMQSWAD